MTNNKKPKVEDIVRHSRLFVGAQETGKHARDGAKYGLGALENYIQGMDENTQREAMRWFKRVPLRMQAEDGYLPAEAVEALGDYVQTSEEFTKRATVKDTLKAFEQTGYNGVIPEFVGKEFGSKQYQKLLKEFNENDLVKEEDSNLSDKQKKIRDAVGIIETLKARMYENTKNQMDNDHLSKVLESRYQPKK